ncbi:MAG: Uma2 family endonuclease [Oscillospiraceae bacterium]|nr:Uma2 family endonuclease [Oscillospiraceae bacterium]
MIKIININNSENRIKEIINGQIYYMLPGISPHGRVISRLSQEFYKFFPDRKCEVLSEGLNVFLEGEESEDFVVPDLVIICDKSKFSIRGYEGAPTLVAEVLSQKTAKKDKEEKLSAYEKAGVKEYWIVNIKDKSVEQRVLIEGKYKLVNIAFILDKEDYRDIEEDKIDKLSKLKCHVFEDLTIDLNGIFDFLI